MTKRIFFSIFLVALTVLTVSVLLTVAMLYHDFTNEYDLRLKEEAYYISQGIEGGGRDYLDTLTDYSSNTRVTWIAPDGTVLYDSSADEATMDNHADREEVREALESGEGEAVRYSDTLTDETMNYALRLSDGSVLRVSDSHDSTVTFLLSLLTPILILAVVVMSVSGVMAYTFARRVTEPLNKLDFVHPENGKAYKELRPLLERLSKQNQQIREQMEQLKRRQKEFAAITDNMTEGLLVVDSNANLLSYNAGALQLLDATHTDSPALGGHDGLQGAIAEALSGNHHTRQMEHDQRIYQIIANPVHVKSETVGAVLLILDVTERESREKLRREFTANVTHELKTPLTSISGFAEMISMGIARPEDVGYFADKIHTEARRLLGLIDDILRLSQLDENSIPNPKEAVDLSAIAAQVVDRLAPQAAERSVTLQKNLTPQTILGVPRILDEMVYNLVENAIKYNKEQGEVFVTVEKEGANVRLTVRDTGIGIPDTDRQRVFERFYRVDKSQSKAIGGTGLGLSIVKHGAVFHGASLTLDSTQGQGTVISVLFPAME